MPLPNLGQGIVRFRSTNGQISTLDCSQITTVFSSTNGCNPLALSVFTNAAARYPANSFDNAISFTNVFSPGLFQRTFSAIDSVNNLTDRVS